jgi:hypothetical protein
MDCIVKPESLHMKKERINKKKKEYFFFILK